jgi:hypothetical protein
MYYLFSTAAEPRTHVPHATLPKIDRLVYHSYDADEVGSGSDQGVVEIVAGTPTSGADLTNPAHWPRVRVAASGGAIAAADIVDERPRTSGSIYIPGEDARANATYGVLPTPDIIRNLVVPSNSKLVITYHALMRATNNNVTRAAIFIGGNQLKVRSSVHGTPSGPVVQAARFAASANQDFYRPLGSGPIGLVGYDISDGSTAWNDDVGTGQAFGWAALGGQIPSVELNANTTFWPGYFHGGECEVFIDPGTVDVDIRFKTDGAGNTVTAKARRLLVEVKPFA